MDDSFEGWTGGKIDNCEDLVYKFTLCNTTESPIQFRIKMKPKSADAEINLYWPVTGVRGSLAAQETATVCLLPKLRPTKKHDVIGVATELDKLEIKLSWKVDDAKLALLKSSQNKQAERAENNKASNDQKKGVSFNEDVQKIPDDGGNGGSAAGVSTATGPDTFNYNPADFAGDSDEKPCGACTFLNPMWAKTCQCCDTPF